MKRTSTALLAALAALTLTLAACGGGSGPENTAAAPQEMAATAYDAGFYQEADMEYEAMAEESGERAEVESAASGAVPAAAENRKIVRNSSLSLETKEFDQGLSEIEKLVAGAGGYIESKNVDGRSISYQGDYYERNASLTARVPAGRLDEVTSKLGDLFNIVARSENADDITDRYFDTQAHLDSLRLQEERLLEILSKAEKLEEVIQLESALSDVRYQIETLTATMKRMDSQVSYSYLNISLREVVEYRQTTAAPKSFGERLSLALDRGGQHLVDSTQGFLLVLAEGLPTLLLWVAIIAGILLVARAVLRRLRGRRNRRDQARREAEEAARREKQDLEARLNPHREDPPEK